MEHALYTVINRIKIDGRLSNVGTSPFTSTVRLVKIYLQKFVDTALGRAMALVAVYSYKVREIKIQNLDLIKKT